MMDLLTTQCLSILDVACASLIGLAVMTNDPARAKAAIYRARRDMGQPAHDDITIRVSPDHPTTEIWLLRKSRISTPTFDIADDMFGRG